MLPSHCAGDKAQDDLIRDEESAKNYCRETKRTLQNVLPSNKIKQNETLTRELEHFTAWKERAMHNSRV